MAKLVPDTFSDLISLHFRRCFGFLTLRASMMPSC